MIKIELVSEYVLGITVTKKLKTDDFAQIAPRVDSIISLRGLLTVTQSRSRSTQRPMSFLPRPRLSFAGSPFNGQLSEPLLRVDRG